MCQKGHSSFPEALILPVYTRRLVEDHSHVSRAVCHHAAAKAELLQEPLRGERAAAAIQPTVEKRANWNLRTSGCGHFSFLDHIADTRVQLLFPTPLNFHILGGLRKRGRGVCWIAYADLHCWKHERICRGSRLTHSTSIKGCVIERRGPLHYFPAQFPLSVSHMKTIFNYFLSRCVNRCSFFWISAWLSEALDHGTMARVSLPHKRATKRQRFLEDSFFSWREEEELLSGICCTMSGHKSRRWMKRL